MRQGNKQAFNLSITPCLGHLAAYIPSAPKSTCASPIECRPFLSLSRASVSVAAVTTGLHINHAAVKLMRISAGYAYAKANFRCCRKVWPHHFCRSLFQDFSCLFPSFGFGLHIYMHKNKSLHQFPFLKKIALPTGSTCRPNCMLNIFAAER